METVVRGSRENAKEVALTSRRTLEPPTSKKPHPDRKGTRALACLRRSLLKERAVLRGTKQEAQRAVSWETTNCGECFGAAKVQPDASRVNGSHGATGHGDIASDSAFGAIA